MDNNFEDIDVLYITNPGSPSIPRLHDSIREKEISIAELADKIGSELCVIDSNPPNDLDQKEKKPRQGRASTRRLFLSPTGTSTLCGGLTECPPVGKCAITLPARPINTHITSPAQFFQHRHTSYFRGPYSSTPPHIIL